MQKWRCHKVVEAAKIRAIYSIHPDEGDGLLLLFEGAAQEVLVDHEWKVKHSPAVGGYFVKYADGYESFSPAAAFEEGYTQLLDEVVG